MLEWGLNVPREAISWPHLKLVVIPQNIQEESIPANFHLSLLKAFDDNTNSMEHIIAFHAQMSMYDTLNTLMYYAFLLMLRGLARE